MNPTDQRLLEEAYNKVSAADIHHPMHKNLKGYASIRLDKAHKDGEDISSVLKELETQSGSAPGTLARSLQYRDIISLEEFQDYIKSRSSDIDPDLLIAYKKVK
jgi:hypothetical protein